MDTRRTLAIVNASYFSECPRDRGGRCLPRGSGSEGGGRKAKRGAKEKAKGELTETDRIKQSLSKGRIASEETIKQSAQITLITTEEGYKGVWKPETGERPLRDSIEPGTYYMREIAAYRVAEIVGLTDMVPVTVERMRGGVFGSVQRFVESANIADDVQPEIRWDGQRDLTRGATFDFVIGNTDRHAANWLVDSSGKMHLIDNGLTFPMIPKRESMGSTPVELSRICHPPGNGLFGKAWEEILPINREGWAGKWPAIQAALRKAGIEKKAILQAKQRYDMLMDDRFQTYRDLWTHYNRNVIVPLSREEW